jgi:alkylhydroperoxidase family enzyme
MRISKPRIAPLADAEASEEQLAVLAPFIARGAAYNIFRTMARHPRALDRFLKWGNYILSQENTLSARTRELAILRVGFNCVAGYEWAQHAVIGRRAGLSSDEIERIKTGPEALGWSEEDRAVLAACDALTGNFFIPDEHWSALTRHLREEQCMDLVYTVGQYTQVSMLLNSFGVQPDRDLVIDPDLDLRPS